MPRLRVFLHNEDNLPLITTNEAVVIAVYATVIEHSVDNVKLDWNEGIKWLLRRGFVLNSTSCYDLHRNIKRKGREIAKAAKSLKKEELYMHKELSPIQWDMLLNFSDS